MKTGVRWGVVAWMATLFTVVANSACVPAGTPGDDVSVCTGAMSTANPHNTSMWHKFFGGSDEVFLINVTGNAVFGLDEAAIGNPQTDGNDTFIVRNSEFHWVLGFGGDDSFEIKNSKFDNVYADTNPNGWRGCTDQNGSDTITVENSISNGYILGGNGNDILRIVDSNVSTVASGYSDIFPGFDYSPYDGNDTILLDHVNFTAPLYWDTTAIEGMVTGGRGDDNITFKNGGESYYVYGGHGNDIIEIFDNEHFNACDINTSPRNADRCGVYGDIAYASEYNATAIPLNHGNDLITFHSADIRDILVHGGDGSDRVVVEAPVQLSGTEFNGGDDRSVADGFVDQLFFSGWQGDINGSLLRNWEQIVFADDADIRLLDMELNASTESGASSSDNVEYGVTIQEQARLRVDHDATVNARMYNNGTIDLTEDGAATATLRIEGNYSADQGYLYLDTVLDGSSPGTSDILHITGDTSGTTELRITNIGGTGAQTTGDGILVVEVDGDSSGVFTLYDSPLVAGNYLYTLHKAANGNWYLRSSLPTISISDDHQTEGTPLQFFITLSDAIENDVTLNVSTADGTALAGNDYTAVNTTVTIPAGQTGVSVTVPTLDDDIDEPDENLTLNGTVTSGNTANIDVSGRGVLADNDDDNDTAVDAGKESASYVEGYVWYDDNLNGKWDGSEKKAVKGVTIELIDSEGNVVAKTQPDDAGYYRFPLTYRESYRLHFVLSGSLREQQYQIEASSMIDEDGYSQPFETIPGTRRSIRLDAGIECGCRNVTNDGVAILAWLWWVYLLGALSIMKRRA